jgi:hypothetical protein
MAEIDSEPYLCTDSALLHILDQLTKREPIFHRSEFGTSREDFQGMTAEDFWEVGASGNRYSRSFVLDVLQRRQAVAHEDVWQTPDFHLRQLGPDTFLLTYTLLQNHERLTRRSTIWQLTPAGWKILFHQGTIVSGLKPLHNYAG